MTDLLDIRWELARVSSEEHVADKDIGPNTIRHLEVPLRTHQKYLPFFKHTTGICRQRCLS